jgi:hypothetical protein
MMAERGTISPSQPRQGAGMMDRFQFIEHQGKKILLVEFGNCPKPEMFELLKHVQATIAEEAPNTVLTLADFTGAHVDKEIAEEMKKILTMDRPFVKRSAWVGTASLPKVFYENFKSFSQRDFPAFETREAAMDWLVKD